MSIVRKIFHFVVPKSIELRKRRFELSLWAFLLSFAYYPTVFGFLAWFALARPLMIIARLKGREAFNAAYFFGFCFSLCSLYWLWIVTPAGLFATIFILGFYYAAVLMLFNKLHQIKPVLGWIAVPFLWVGLEYFRTVTEFAFPWSDLGYTQTYYLWILQIVSVVSVHGLSLLILTVNVLIAQVLRTEVRPDRRFTAGLSAFGIVLALMAYGWIVLPKYPVPGKVPLALLQGSIPMDLKWGTDTEYHSFRVYDSLSQSVKDSGAMLYVWPETAAPAYLNRDEYHRKMVGDIATRSFGYHLVGAMGDGVRDGRNRYFNSCFQFNPGGQVEQRQDKVHLVPFTEAVPYQDHLPFLRQEYLVKYLTFIRTMDINWWSDFYPGDSAVLFSLPDMKYGVLICFESTFPEYSRQLILKGADFLVGITNDSWWGTSIALHMHSRIFITRAVENRCWMARAANSGLTYVVDAGGRVREHLPLDVAQALVGRVNLLDGFSVYTRIGDLAGKLSFLITLLVCAILVIRWVVLRFVRF
ncbi:MAG: apolipoprotein N-acyltransferase [candidate division Zixibacteria bacterium]|nr:apolipoprotein N-acyltransferase [candidate division Zixibacteria bacterium]